MRTYYKIGKSLNDYILGNQGRADYGAQVLSVIDGDILWLDIDCGFGVWTKQKVRLRGIDTPELETAAGVQARDFVGVTTTKPDKYDRYLADVFYLPGEDDPARVLADGTFLNWALYKAGLAAWRAKTRLRQIVLTGAGGLPGGTWRSGLARWVPLLCVQGLLRSLINH